MSTRTEMVDRAATRFRDTGKVIVTADEWCNYLNEAYKAVLKASPYWPFMEVRPTALSYAVGTNSAALPGDVWKVVAVFNDTDKIPMQEFTDRASYRDVYPLGSASPSTPLEYRVFAGNLEVFPFPERTTSVIVDAYQPPALLTSDSSEPVFAEQYHPMLIEWALAHAYLDDGNKSQYDAHIAVFSGFLSDMKNDLLTGRGESYPAITDVMEWTS